MIIIMVRKLLCKLAETKLVNYSIAVPLNKLGHKVDIHVQ